MTPSAVQRVPTWDSNRGDRLIECDDVTGQPFYRDQWDHRHYDPDWRNSGHGTRPAEPELYINVEDIAPRWPTIKPAAFYGLAGKIVKTLEPHTEADNVAVLVTFLVGIGAALNSGPHAIADGADHPARLFAVLVGRTSRARKGTAWENVRRILEVADPEFVAERVTGGIASGEGFIAAVGDGTANKDGTVIGDVSDKRALFYEPEFARVLKVCARDSSTASAILRDAWDRGDLRVTTRHHPLRATGAHICLLGHITAEELRRHLTETDAASGYGNRHLFIAARRSKKLPAGGNLDDSELYELGQEVALALERARKIGIVRRSADAERLWEIVYNGIDDDVDGMVGALTARAEAQMLRLSLMYALLDGSRTVEPPHLQAAHAVWTYAEDTVRYIFGEGLGDDIADRLLTAIREAGPAGLSLTDEHNVFGRHVTAARRTQVRRTLEQSGRVVTRTRESGGRPTAVAIAAEHAQEAQESTGA